MGEMPDLAGGRQFELLAKLPLEGAVPGRIEAAQVFEVVLERQSLRQLLALGYIADALEVARFEPVRRRAEHVGLSAVGLQNVHQQADRSGLARAVGTDEREHRAFRYSQIQVFDGLEATERLRQALRLNDHSRRP